MGSLTPLGVVLFNLFHRCHNQTLLLRHFLKNTSSGFQDIGNVCGTLKKYLQFVSFF